MGYRGRLEQLRACLSDSVFSDFTLKSGLKPAWWVAYLHYRKPQTHWGLFSKSWLLNIYHCPRACNVKGGRRRPVKEAQGNFGEAGQNQRAQHPDTEAGGTAGGARLQATGMGQSLGALCVPVSTHSLGDFDHWSPAAEAADCPHAGRGGDLGVASTPAPPGQAPPVALASPC